MNNDGVDNLEYSPEGLASRALLFNGVNDINLYVEDTAKEYEYETIFKLHVRKELSYRNSVALGGKEGVKNHFQEYGEETDGVKNYYIVDGDFDRYIHPETMVNSHCFIYLESYNIENYFLDEKACLDFAKGKLQCLDDEVKRRVAFSNWREKIVEQAKKLFLCY